QTTEDDEHLEAHDERQTAREHLDEQLTGGQGDTHATLHQDEDDHQDGHETGQTEFLGQGGEDEVAVRGEDLVCLAPAHAGAEQPSVGHADLALDQLHATADRVVDLLVESVEPDVDTLFEVPE